MSNWLKKRVVMWCALVVLLGGGWWFSSVRAYTTLSSPPAKTPEDAAASFMAMLTDFSAFPDSDYDGHTRLESKNIMAHLLDQTISHAQMQKVGRYNNSSLSNVAVLLSWMAQMQRSRNYKGNVIEQDADKAVVELQKVDPPVPPPIVCIAEDGGWRVDFFATYAKWKALSDVDRDILILRFTGEISPLIANQPEVIRAVNRAHEVEQRTSCLSNLKQISLGMMQYVQDYDEKMPPARAWADLLQPYTKNPELFRCPSVPKGAGFGYAFNARLSQKSLSALENVDGNRMVMIYETTDLKWNAYGLGEKSAFRHFDGANYANLYGDVKWYKKDQPLQFTFQPKK